MKRPIFALAMALCAVKLAFAQAAPIADHHQHVFSPAAAAMLSTAQRSFNALPAGDVVALLDAAKIQRGVLLSVAYMYGSPSRTVEDEYAKVRAENDWTGAQAARYPSRLIAFCGVNPLKDYALDEIARCAASPQLRRGLKLHFGNSDVQLERPEHLARMREIFGAANRHRMAIAVHMRASISKQRPYGAAQANLFLEQLMPLAIDIPVQVAHMAGSGPGYDDAPAEAAMAALAEAAERRDPRTQQLWFDVASSADAAISEAHAALLAKRIRQVGTDRILYGSDAAVADNLRPRAAWEAFRRLPLTDAEFERIAANVAPYFLER